MSKFLTIFSISLFILLETMTKSVYAADCTIVYGGGQVDCANITPVVVSPTPASQQGVPTPTKTTPVNQTQSKGGLPIQPKTDVKTTPATGPEMLGLISLIPMAAAGFYLRKKTK